MKPRNTLLSTLFVTLSLTAAASAADYQWDVNGAAAGLGGTETWNTTNTFWDDLATGTNTGTDSTVAVSSWTTSDNATFGGSGGTVTLGGTFSLGRLNVSGANYSFTGANTITVNANSTWNNEVNLINGAKLEIKNGAVISAGTAGFHRIGQSGIGTVELSGTGSGYTTQTGVTIFGQGTLTVGAGTSYSLTGTSGSSLLVGQGKTAADTATLNVSGTLTYNNTGAFVIANGNSNGIVNLNSGGVIETSRSITKVGAGAANLNFNGGTLKVTNALATTIGNVVMTMNAGATIDVASGITFSTGANALLGGTGTQTLSKTGPGTLVLGGANTYSGPTTVNEGQLNLSSTTTSNITVKSGAAVGGVGVTSGTLTLETGSAISINGLIASAAVEGDTVDITGPTTVKFDAIPAFGTPQTVLYYTSALTPGSLANLSAGPGLRATFSENIGMQSVEVTLVSGTARTWNAAESTAWDVLANNWVEEDNNFALGDAVTFNDTDPVGTVVLSGTLGPESVVINNPTTNYTFSGIGKISGATGLTKNSSGSAVILTNNDFTGSVVVNGGSLIVGNGTTGSIASTCPVSIATGATFEVFRGTTTVPNVFSGSGTLSFRSTGVSGVGDFSGISGVSSFTGGVLIDDSRLQITAANQLASATGINVLNGGQLFLNSSGSDFATATYTYDRNVTITGNGWLEGGGPFGALRMRGVTASGNFTLAGNSRVQVFGPSATFVSTISGVISDGGSGFGLEVQASAADRVLSLTGTNTYSGPTTVTSGTLRVDGDSLPDGGRLDINGSSKVEITEPVDPAVEVVDTLYIAGIQQNAGTYGATGSGATNIDDVRFAGAGVIQVTTGPAGYDAWSLRIDDVNKRGRNDDADGDGFTNLQEFLFGKDPELNNGALTTTERTTNGLVIRWTQRTGAGAPTYKLLENATLANSWTEWVPGTAPFIIENDGSQDDQSPYGIYQPMKATVPVSASKNFFRVEGVEN